MVELYGLPDDLLDLISIEEFMLNSRFLRVVFFGEMDWLRFLENNEWDVSFVVRIGDWI
jgi:hypothetical protein